MDTYPEKGIFVADPTNDPTLQNLCKKVISFNNQIAQSKTVIFRQQSLCTVPSGSNILLPLENKKLHKSTSNILSYMELQAEL